MEFNIKKQKEKKDTYYFRDLNPGQFFFDEDNDLALKVKDPVDDCRNAMIINLAELYYYEAEEEVIPVDYELNIYREDL